MWVQKGFPIWSTRLRGYQKFLYKRSLHPSLIRTSISQNSGAQSFLCRVQSLPTGPGISLDDVLQPSLDEEAELRKTFATDRQNTRLNDKYVGLVDVYAAPDDIRTTRARLVKNDKDLSAKHVMPLLEEDRRKEGEPCMVPDLDEFKKNWSVFTEGSLSQLLDWNNVVAAGGSVLACLTPLPEFARASKRAMRKYYHESAYPTSDVDLFLYGMTPEGAEAKIKKIYEAVRDSVPWDVTCIRTKHTVSIHSQYPYRPIQIVLRLYNSPAEILAGFDIDSACFAYDGSRVWSNPRSIVAMMRQCNTIDMSRRSPSYEVRLAKYSSRSFEVYVPTLNRADVDPTIYERSITRVNGLARLLVLEKLKDTDSRSKFVESRRALRGRPNESNRYTRKKRQLKGDLRANMAIGGLEMNDYDVVSLHIPYGPGWNARKIDKLVYLTDLGMNSPFNPRNKDRRLHRHPAFFGTGKECLEDCCECCPDPVDENERQLQKEEDERYIRGRISFIEDDPGRQSITGSFNPIDVGEWSEQVYIGPTEKLFVAIVTGNRATVAKMIEEGTGVTRRDHVGRMPLHVAIMAKQEEIACYLIDNGARITSRLADGRTALHLAAQMDMLSVVKKLLERNRVNKQLLEEGGKTKGNENEDENKDEGAVMRDNTVESPSSKHPSSLQLLSPPSSAPPIDTIPPTPELPEDEVGEPDVFDVNAPDWGLALTPLNYAVLFASMPVVDVFLDHKDIDLSRVTQAKHVGAPALVSLTVAMYRQDEAEAVKIIERLVAAGASSSNADDALVTTFSKFVQANKTQLVLTLLRVDPKAVSVINFPAVEDGYYNRDVTFPLNYAISNDNYAMVAALLAYGAKFEFDERDITEALKLQSQKNPSGYSYNQIPENRLDMTTPLIENALGIYSDLVRLLISLGASVDIATTAARRRYASKQDKMSLLDWVQFSIDKVDEALVKLEKDQVKVPKDDEAALMDGSWKSYCANYIRMADENTLGKSIKHIKEEEENKKETWHVWMQVKAYLTDMERLLVSRDARTYNDLNPNDEVKPEPRRKQLGTVAPAVLDASGLRIKYEVMDSSYGGGHSVPQHQVLLYEELFEACWKGDNATIRRLCLSSEAPNTEQLPIQIAAKIGHPTNDWGQTGLTTLSVAVARGHWDTAKLIFTTSIAQYKPDGKEQKFEYSLENFEEDESDDDPDLDLVDSDDIVNKAPVDFVDVAKCSSEVQTSVPPSKMLHDIGYSWRQPDSGLRRYSKNLITGAVEHGDVHAFTTIFDLYKLSDPPLILTSSELDQLLETIVSNDKPELLHEFIRKTGRGVTVKRKPSAKEGKEGGRGEEEAHAANNRSKVYHGLNVHGKKRRDLAAKNDPNANHDEVQVIFPLVWRAAHAGSLAILDYLKSERPLEAYRHYSMCNSDPLAISLRRTADLDKVLPQWLGWTINAIGESPLSAALLRANNLPVVKSLFENDSELMSMALKQDIKFIGYNLLMLAVHCGCTTKMVDYLLSKRLSPTQVDSRGWNIYHMLAGSGNFLLFQHFLKILPRDISQALLTQPSKQDFDTPLHLAVENRYKDIVEAITNFDKSSLLIRNVKGSLPLHTTILNALPEVTKMVLHASPTEELHSENGVGDTPFEIATSRYLLSLMKDVKGSSSTVSSFAREAIPTRRNVEKLEEGVIQLRKMIAALLDDKKLVKDSHLEKELSAFAGHLDSQIVNAKPDHEAKKKREAEKVEKTRHRKEEEEKKAAESVSPSVIRVYDDCDSHKTYEYVKEAVEARPHERRLVHLVDVQKSVLGDLSKVESKKQKEAHDHGDGLEPEKDKRRIPDEAMVFRYHGLGNIVS